MCPYRRPPRPQHPIVGVCRRGGLHFGRLAAPNRDLTAPNRVLAASKWGNCTNRGATRRRHADRMLLMVQNPPPLPEQSQVAAPMSARARPRHPLTRSRGSHTQARDAVFAGTRHTPPTKTPTFPHQKAQKSPFQQHDLSILIVGPNQLKHRLSRTRKPKSHHKTNTFCPSSTLAPTN